MAEEDKIFAKAAWRLIPFMGLLYLVAFLDRVNVSFAALTMNRDLGFTPEIFGFGAGVFFFGYFLFEVPSNVILTRVGARIWICRIMLTWGAISMAMAFVQGPTSFYALRFLLGLAEAGFAPGMLLYLTFWFPPALRTRYMAYYLCAIPLAGVIGAPLSSIILQMDGVGGLAGWQWLFVLEGIPACILGLVVLRYLPDGPGDAKWLTFGERERIVARLAQDTRPAEHSLWAALTDPKVLVLCAAYFGIVVALYGCTIWLPQIVQAMGYSILETGFLVGAVYSVAVGVMIMWSLSSERRREWVWHVALAALIAAGALAVAAASPSDLLTLAALTIATGCIYATLSPFWIIPPSFLGGTAAAGGIALINSVGNLGGFVGPALLGRSSGETGGYGLGMIALAVGLVLAAILVLALARAIRPHRANEH